MWQGDRLLHDNYMLLQVKFNDKLKSAFKEQYVI